MARDIICDVDGGPQLAGGRTRDEAEDDDETGAWDWLADALAAYAEDNPGTLFYSDEDD